MAPGGAIVGRLVSQEGNRVTIITENGGRITVESTDVTPVSSRRSTRLRREEPEDK